MKIVIRISTILHNHCINTLYEYNNLYKIYNSIQSALPLYRFTALPNQRKKHHQPNNLPRGLNRTSKRK